MASYVAVVWNVVLLRVADETNDAPPTTSFSDRCVVIVAFLSLLHVSSYYTWLSTIYRPSHRL